MTDPQTRNLYCLGIAVQSAMQRCNASVLIGKVWDSNFPGHVNQRPTSYSIHFLGKPPRKAPAVKDKCGNHSEVLSWKINTKASWKHKEQTAVQTTKDSEDLSKIAVTGRFFWHKLQSASPIFIHH